MTWGGGERLFTEYVRWLERGQPPDERTFERVWRALRAALVSELRKRGLWESPPSHLGIHGHDVWEPAGARELGAGRRDDPLDELVVEAYLFVFIQRLRSLAAQLAIKDNVDGLIFLNLRHFLSERQQAHDPLGYRVFECLYEAVRGAIAAGRLHLWAGDPRVRNDTVLGFGPAPPSGPAAPRREIDFTAAVAAWCQELLPDLVTAKGGARAAVLGRLERFVLALGTGGVESFRFKQLIDPLKSEVRRRWQAAAREALAPEALGDDFPFALPELEKESFARLAECIERRLAGLPLAERTDGELSSLWRLLKARTAGRPGGPAEDEGGRLSRRRLAEALGIPRERLSAPLATLGRWVEECRAAARYKAPLSENDHER